MSLINQMLRDLDKGRGPVKASQIAALQGMGLININRFKRYDSLSLTAWGLAGLLSYRCELPGKHLVEQQA